MHFTKHNETSFTTRNMDSRTEHWMSQANSLNKTCLKVSTKCHCGRYLRKN